MLEASPRYLRKPGVDADALVGLSPEAGSPREEEVYAGGGESGVAARTEVTSIGSRGASDC